MVLKVFGKSFFNWCVHCFQHRKWLALGLLSTIFISSLTALLHWKEEKVDHLILNSTANKYIIAQVGFGFPDHERTQIMKDEVMFDIGAIYALDDRQILKAESEIQSKIMARSRWREDLPSVTFEDLIRAKEGVRNELLKVRFIDTRTSNKLKESGISPDSNLIYEPEVLEGQIPENICKEIGSKVGGVSHEIVDYYIREYQNYPWSLAEDFEYQNSIKQSLAQNISLIITKIKPGTRIINAGDRVTMRHIHMLEAMKEKMAERSTFFSWPLLGNFVIALSFTILVFLFFNSVSPDNVRFFSQLSVIVAVILLTFTLAKISDAVLINKLCPYVNFWRCPILTLFPAMTLSVLLDRRLAMSIAGLMSILFSMIFDVEYNYFLFTNIFAALSTVFFVKIVRKRRDIFKVCFRNFLALIPVIFALNLREEVFWSSYLFTDLLTAFLCISISSVLVVTLLPILESVFKIVTDMTLLEAGELSHPLLRRLNLEAPGTYRHSLAVAALAEEAALAINANPVFCRVASLYHDIGKMMQSQYFTENQFSGFNMHQLLTPLESAQVIIAHVSEGVKLAEQYELPWSVIDVIKEHHGSGLVYYFYHAQIEQARLKSITVDERLFRYTGPIPHSRESAIIMIADSVEAAFRCLDEVNEKTVSELVESIVNHKIREHQLDNSRLTFDEVESIKKSIVRALVDDAHTRRVKYPERLPSLGLKTEEAYSRVT